MCNLENTCACNMWVSCLHCVHYLWQVCCCQGIRVCGEEGRL
jgi:hypothetical protein